MNLPAVQMAPALSVKSRSLEAWFAPLDSVTVAFSGGVDSALVAWVACAVLGPERVRAVIADSPSLPRHELEAAESFAREHGIPSERVRTNELERPGYAANESDRCYHCKQELYAELSTLASFPDTTVLNGTNADDTDEWRPGLAAAAEHGVRSPLLECGLSKQEVRDLSRAFGLSTWDKPALPCLASRIPYGTEVTPERLAEVERAESVLREEGFRVYRVRHHGARAWIEVGEGERDRLSGSELRARVEAGVMAAGFTEVHFEEEPYRRGRLNDALLQIETTARQRA